VFRRDVFPMTDAAAFIPDAERQRMLFVIPWLDSVLVGTTDTPHVGTLDHPVVEPEDRRYCLDAVNATFKLDLDESDIAGAYAGLRPLIAGKRDATADLSRRHAVYDIAPGIIGITGGKLTTYRRMSREAVDRVAEDLGINARSRSRWIRLGSSKVGPLQAAVDRRSRRLGISDESAANLVRCFGDRALEVLDIAEREDLTQPLAPGHPPIVAEAAYVARHEMAVTLSDLLARRTRLALTDPNAGIGPGSVGTELLRSERGWSDAETLRQIAAHRGEVEHERALPLPGLATKKSTAAAQAHTG
jgi:glycerol-3-phosphate dehydrogenase